MGAEVVEKKGKLDEYGRSKQRDGPNANYNITPKVVRKELLAGVESFTEPVNTDNQTGEQVQSSYQTCDHERIDELSGECGLSGHVLYVSLMFIHEHYDEWPKYEDCSCRYDYYRVLGITVPATARQIWVDWMQMCTKPLISLCDLFAIESQITELHGER